MMYLILLKTSQKFCVKSYDSNKKGKILPPERGETTFQHQGGSADTYKLSCI